MPFLFYTAAEYIIKNLVALKSRDSLFLRFPPVSPRSVRMLRSETWLFTWPYVHGWQLGLPPVGRSTRIIVSGFSNPAQGPLFDFLDFHTS